MVTLSQHLRTSLVPADAPPLGAYRTVTRDATLKRRLMGVHEAKKADLVPPGWFDRWADATFATDPVGARQTPPVLRAPNGVAQDSRDDWLAGKPLYQPSDVRVPTLLLHAEWDTDLPTYQIQAYFDQLSNTPYKRWVQLGEGPIPSCSKRIACSSSTNCSAFCTKQTLSASRRNDLLPRCNSPTCRAGSAPPGSRTVTATEWPKHSSS